MATVVPIDMKLDLFSL